MDLATGIADILLKKCKGDLAFRFAFLLSLMDIQDMRGDLLVVLVCVHIPDDEDAVESGQDCCLQFHLL